MQKDEKKPLKFPHKGRAGFIARREAAAKVTSNKLQVTSGNKEVKTGWGKVAQWYHDTVEDQGSYQRDLILPNIIRLLDIKKGEMILDLACGEGFFARRYVANGAGVIGVDVAVELIEIARKAGGKDSSQVPAVAKAMVGKQNDKGGPIRKEKAENPKYYVAGADKIPFVADSSIDKITIILALQNIENVGGVLKECARVLKPGGKLFLVLNHPAFRIPKASGWGWAGQVASDKSQVTSGDMIQYRRMDTYMSELREKIDMHPSASSGQVPGKGEMTVTFHRPLQYFVKLIGKAGLAIVNMEEWVSNRKSQPGPRTHAEDKARAEFPLFMMLEVRKLS